MAVGVSTGDADDQLARELHRHQDSGKPDDDDDFDHDAIMKARTEIRWKAYHPGQFHGRIFLLSSLLIHAADPMLGWGRYLKGEVSTRQLAGDHLSYLWEDLRVNARIIGDLLASITTPTTRK